MLPLSLLKTSQGHPVMVELKNGETYNGTLLFCDSWMNLHLREVILSSRDGAKFYRLAEAYVRGNTIKYMRVADSKYLVRGCRMLAGSTARVRRVYEPG